MSASPKYEVRWVRMALQDMQNIAQYLAQHDAQSAQCVVEHIWQAGQSLASLPSRGRPGRVPETRELVLTDYPYFLVYRVREAKVQILRIIHTAQEYASQ